MVSQCIQNRTQTPKPQSGKPTGSSPAYLSSSLFLLSTWSFLSGNMSLCSYLEPFLALVPAPQKEHPPTHPQISFAWLFPSLFLRLKCHLFFDHHVLSSHHKHFPFLNTLAVYWNYHIFTCLLSLALEFKFLEATI